MKEIGLNTERLSIWYFSAALHSCHILSSVLINRGAGRGEGFELGWKWCSRPICHIGLKEANEGRTGGGIRVYSCCCPLSSGWWCPVCVCDNLRTDLISDITQIEVRLTGDWSHKRVKAAEKDHSGLLLLGSLFKPVLLVVVTLCKPC